jgi:hypothetical protein
MTGFKSIPLTAKLGIKSGEHVLILNPPENYPAILGKMPPDVKFARDIQTPLDFIQYFTHSRVDLEKALPALKSIMAIDGMIWICWPKEESNVPTDLNEEVVRETGLYYGLVDVKVLSIDPVWAGCKFVYRQEEHSRP